MIDRDTIARAKAVLPLPALWQKLGWPGEPKKACRVPFRADDTRESGSVFQKGTGEWCFHDFKSGESFDEIRLLAEIEGINQGEALKTFLALAGLIAPDTSRPSLLRQSPPVNRSPSPARETKPERKPYIAPLREPTLEECEMIAASRGVICDAVLNAATDGLLFIGQRLDCASWVLTDSERWNAQYRRMEAAPYVLPDGREVKTLGVKNGWAAWPLGLPALAIESRSEVLLVEGPPDALAAYQIALEAGRIANAAVVCMTGAGLRIPAECLPAFKAKRVRIYCDADSSGRAAAVRWEGQLREAGAVVDAFDLSGLLQADGKPVKDLNDVCRMAAPERAALGLMEGMNQHD
jgi:hypothetical protein